MLPGSGTLIGLNAKPSDGRLSTSSDTRWRRLAGGSPRRPQGQPSGAIRLLAAKRRRLADFFRHALLGWKHVAIRAHERDEAALPPEPYRLVDLLTFLPHRRKAGPVWDVIPQLGALADSGWQFSDQPTHDQLL